MNVRKFGWLPAHRRLLLIAALQDRIDQWMRDWSLQPTCASLCDEHDAGPLEWQLVHARADAKVGFGFEAGVLARLGAHFAQVGDGTDSLLARELGLEALRDLVVRMLAVEALHQAPAIDPGTLGPDAFAGRYGACIVTVGIDDISLHLAMSRATVDALVPPASAAASNLVARTEALTTSNVELDLLLPLGGFALDEVLGLSQGDILLSETKLDAPFELSASGNALGLRCRLARVGERKAAYIDEPEISA